MQLGSRKTGNRAILIWIMRGSWDGLTSKCGTLHRTFPIIGWLSLGKGQPRSIGLLLGADGVATQHPKQTQPLGLIV